jgi:plastocyanin domain-containing protein
MDPVALWVTVGGVAFALAVNLYFFSPRRAVVARPAAVAPPAGAARSAPVEAPQEARITVRGGYEPSVIEVRVGRPVRLTFRREETEGCSDTVLLPEWRIFHHLPAHEDTVVEFTPEHTGEFEFTCGMQMMRGRIVVR